MEITRVKTIHKSVYLENVNFDKLKKTAFENAWHYLGNKQLLTVNNQFPVKVLPGFLDESLVVTKDKDETLECLSNVCTHRGNLLVYEPCKMAKIVCKYHGRRFNLKGEFEFMPEFEGVENFPCESDNLNKLPLRSLGNLLFTSLSGKIEFEKFFEPITTRLHWLDWSSMKFYPEYSATYTLDANWALYVDNYLEGFHIPFVHPDLNKVVDYSSYTSEIFEYCNLQLAVAKGGELKFNLPESSQDFGKDIAAYYFWVYPNMMFNFYPWGLSLNVVKPISIDKTQIDFFTFISNFETYKYRDQHALNITEMEDEEIVLKVQEGIKSRFYQNGRYSPKMEQGVFHFHQLLSKDLDLLRDEIY